MLILIGFVVLLVVGILLFKKSIEKEIKKLEEDRNIVQNTETYI